MIIFRKAQFADLAGIHKLAKSAGAGITSLPKDKKYLQKKLSWAIDSFEKIVTQPAFEYYLFVLEDNKEIIGTAAIKSCSAKNYVFRIVNDYKYCKALEIKTNLKMLILSDSLQNNSELCTLFLDKNYRAHNNSNLLIKARFLFIKIFFKRFFKVFSAEMRGVPDIFWQQVMTNFFKMSFLEADSLSATTDCQFIADLMPREPIYVNLLPLEVQSIIGSCHSSTQAARYILEKEGFKFIDAIDIFDAGPILEARVIKTVNNSDILKVIAIEDISSKQKFVVSNTKLNFKAIVTTVLITPSGAIIADDCAKSLEIVIADSICVTAL